AAPAPRSSTQSAQTHRQPVLDQEPPRRGIRLLSVRADQRLEYPALHLLRTLPRPRPQPAMARILCGEQRLGVLTAHLHRRSSEPILLIKEHQIAEPAYPRCRPE